MMDHHPVRTLAADPVRISVVMAVYNGAAYLAAAIDSVLAQDYPDFEFLIHDDGSQDESWAILSAYADKDPRISLSRGTNQGLPVTLNQLIDRARGDLIARFDADDICLPDRFSRQVERLDQNPDVIVLGGAVQIIDGEGRTITVHRPPLIHDDIDRSNLNGNTAFFHPAVMMRRKAFLAARGYHPDFKSAQDQDLWLRMGEIGQLANLPEVLIRYRVHGGSISGSKRDLQRQLCLRACEEAWARRGIANGSFKYQDWRMGDDARSRLTFHINYAWQAWSSGYRDTWRHYALKAVRQAPLSKAAWKVLVMGALRRPAPKAGQERG